MKAIPSYVIVTPLLYWFRTRIPENNIKLQYILAVLLPQAIGLYLMLPVSSEACLIFVLFFIGMISVYEIGYFDNDYLGRQRERKAGLYVRKPEPMPVTNKIWFIAILLRLIVVTIVFFVVGSLGGNSWVFVGWLIAVMAIFSLHNLLLGLDRLWSFFGIYFIRIQLPVVVCLSVGFDELTRSAVVAWLIFSIIHASTHAYFYSVKKGFLKRELWVQRIESVTFTMIVIVVLQTIVIPFLLMAGMVGIAYSLVMLTIYSVIYVFVWGGGRFVAEAIKAFQRRKHELTHTHTNFSHDATISMQYYSDLLERWPGSIIYLTDHAEDFSDKRYNKLKEEFAALAPRVIPGLEYTICYQHVLAHGLKDYVEINKDEVVSSLARLKEESSRLIWAHPKISVKKLTDKSYRLGLLNLAAGVDGIELYNCKNNSRWRWVMEMAIISCLCCLVFGRRSLFIGLDCHRPEELP